MSCRGWWAAALLLLACGEAEDTQDSQVDDPMDWALEDLGGACAGDEHVGWFELAQWEDADPSIAFSTVTGVVMDGVIPTTVLFEELSEGDCTLWRKVNPFCDPGCGTDEVCTHDGECAPYPAQLDLGTVTVEGLGGALSMEPDGFANYWDTSVGYPLFEPGARLRVRSDSGLELRGLGVDSLRVDDPAWQITRGEDLEVSWIPGTAEARITLSFNVDQHGNSPITMRCEVDDLGSATVPAAVLEALLDRGVSGFASGWMRRGSADRTTTEHGCVDLQVYSHRGTELTVEGHIPCSWDGDCPDGWSCDLETNTCVEP
jgi:hypothetical protein